MAAICGIGNGLSRGGEESLPGRARACVSARTCRSATSRTSTTREGRLRQHRQGAVQQRLDDARSTSRSRRRARAEDADRVDRPSARGRRRAADELPGGALGERLGLDVGAAAAVGSVQSVSTKGRAGWLGAVLDRGERRRHHDPADPGGGGGRRTRGCRRRAGTITLVLVSRVTVGNGDARASRTRNRRPRRGQPASAVRSAGANSQRRVGTWPPAVQRAQDVSPAGRANRRAHRVGPSVEETQNRCARQGIPSRR